MILSLLLPSALAVSPSLFGAPVTVTPLGGYGTDVKTGDFNGDGAPDISIATSADLASPDRGRLFDLELSLTDGSGGFTPSVSTTPLVSGWTMVTDVGDLDGDGLADLVAGHFGGFSVFFSDGLALTGEVDYPGPHVGPVELGDMDGDGDLDLVTLDDTAEVHVYENDGLGGFTLAQAIVTSAGPVVDSEWDSLDLRDLDGDGALDLVLVIANNMWLGVDPLAVFLGDGAGGVDPTAYTGPSGGAATVEVYDLALGDLDNDGRVDLLFGGGGYEVYTIPWDGGYAPTSSWPIASMYAWSWVLAGDIDGDGDDDAVGTTGNTLSALVQDGGLLTDPGETWLYATWTNFVVADDGFELVDMNGDGCADLVTWVLDAGATILPATSAACTGAPPTTWTGGSGGDTGGGDTGGGDTGTVDTGTVDTGAADTGTADTSAEDTADPSYPPVDTSSAPPPSGTVSGCGVTSPQGASLLGLAGVVGLIARRRRGWTSR